ncbi:helix-turn-helix domain-containing protein [Celerinatantimonas diazotrophica]
MQPTLTANAQYIHRSTLEYRLNKVHDLTGLDIRNHFFDHMLW